MLMSWTLVLSHNLKLSKDLNAPTISTAYHNPTHGLCCPQCRWPPIRLNHLSKKQGVYPRKGLSITSKRSRLVVCGLGRVEKSQICKIHPLATFCHFGASWKVNFARFLTFERGEIEVWSFWQKWPTLCGLRHCFWWEDLKTNILGSKAAFVRK